MSRSFLELLFDTKPAKSHILVWTKSPSEKKVSRWFDNTKEATLYAERQGESCDTYFGIGLSPNAKAADKRVESDKVCGIPGLWVDLDIQHPVHKKKNLPPTLDDALILIQQMPTVPTIINHTGHGLQAYWLFNDVATIESDKERLFYAQIVLGWQRLLKTYANQQKWDVDSTFDLARVFRVPNTLNHKEAEPKPVSILKRWLKHRYNPIELRTMVRKASPSLWKEVKSGEGIHSPLKLVAKQSKSFVLNPKADVSKLKFDMLCDVEPKFKKSWERKRRDFGDQSPSTYDLSLATFAVMAQWSDQEIVDLLVASRIKHKDDLKFNNLQYYTRTLLTAHAKVERDEKVEVAVKKPLSDDIEENLADISTLLNIPVLHIYRYPTEPPEYEMVIAVENKDHETMVNKQIAIPHTAFLRQGELQQIMFDYAHTIMPHFKPDQWIGLAQKMLNVIEEKRLGNISSAIDIFAHWLYKYLIAFYRDDVEEESQSSRAIAGRPARIAGVICISYDEFNRYIQTEFGERPKRTSLMRHLKRLGCDGKSQSVYNSETKKVTSRYVYIVPDDFMKNHEKRMKEGEIEDIDENHRAIAGLDDDDPVH